jgi:hypothetical protein
LQFDFGYSDIRFHLFSGLQLDYLIKNELSYSTYAIPWYHQEGVINISFDRKRLSPEFQLGAGMRYQISKMYIGVDLIYYIGISHQSRFNPSRTIHIYQDLESPFSYYSPRYRNHGIMINLVFQKRNSR